MSEIHRIHTKQNVYFQESWSIGRRCICARITTQDSSHTILRPPESMSHGTLIDLTEDDAVQIHKVPVLPPMKIEAPVVCYPCPPQVSIPKSEQASSHVRDLIDLTDLETLQKASVAPETRKRRPITLESMYQRKKRCVEFLTGDEYDEQYGDDSDDQEYVVDAILDCRCSGGNMEYLVKWKYFALSHSTWTPRSHLEHLPVLDRFEWEVAEGLREVVSWRL